MQTTVTSVTGASSSLPPAESPGAAPAVSDLAVILPEDIRLRTLSQLISVENKLRDEMRAYTPANRAFSQRQQLDEVLDAVGLLSREHIFVRPRAPAAASAGRRNSAPVSPVSAVTRPISATDAASFATSEETAVRSSLEAGWIGMFRSVTIEVARIHRQQQGWRTVIKLNNRLVHVARDPRPSQPTPSPPWGASSSTPFPRPRPASARSIAVHRPPSPNRPPSARVSSTTALLPGTEILPAEARLRRTVSTGSRPTSGPATSRRSRWSNTGRAMLGPVTAGNGPSSSGMRRTSAIVDVTPVPSSHARNQVALTSPPRPRPTTGGTSRNSPPSPTTPAVAPTRRSPHQPGHTLRGDDRASMQVADPFLPYSQFGHDDTRLDGDLEQPVDTDRTDMPYHSLVISTVRRRLQQLNDRLRWAESMHDSAQEPIPEAVSYVPVSEGNEPDQWSSSTSSIPNPLLQQNGLGSIADESEWQRNVTQNVGAVLHAGEGVVTQTTDSATEQFGLESVAAQQTGLVTQQHYVAHTLRVPSLLSQGFSFAHAVPPQATSLQTDDSPPPSPTPINTHAAAASSMTVPMEVDAPAAARQPHALEKTLCSFICPITRCHLEDPVIAADGFTYERSAIERWLSRSDRSPSTNLALPHRHVVPNHGLRSAIQEWRQVRGY